MYRRALKPFFDRLFAGAGLLVLTPFFLVLACLILLQGKHPVFFMQWRVGLGGKKFRLLKFQTMNEAKSGIGDLLPEEDRVTLLGGFLRRTSIDELPQLINVFKGEMSLVGPRPLPVEYWPLYSEEQKRRHDVLPGITGWAQVNGRNEISWASKFELDLYYIRHQSPALDLNILFKTAIILFSFKKDVSLREERFTGN